ncbi:hypothetical protein [Shimia sp.]|uniref:hypothetical protein n=1 Tax=Shimia sp. TaxID=1954381 RepID=UPI003566A708
MRLSAAAICLSALVLAPPAFADLAEDCQMQADIVTRAVELRSARKSQDKALEIMTSGEDEAVAEKYLKAVPFLVDWVYTLKRKELKLDPGQAYFDTCMAQ